MSSHREEALCGAQVPPADRERRADEPRSGAGPSEPAPKAALLLIEGGARLTPEQQALVVQAIRLVNWVIRQRVPGAPKKLRAELRAEALRDVAIAAQRFDPSRGVTFTSYVMPWIRGAIEDYFDKEGRYNALRRAGVLAGRELAAERSHRVDWEKLAEHTPETSEEALVTLASRLIGSMAAGTAFEHADPEEDLVEQLAHRQVIELMRAAFARMTKLQRRVITLRFLEQQTLPRIAEELGIDERSVTRHLDQALDMLRGEVAAAGIPEMPRPGG